MANSVNNRISPSFPPSPIAVVACADSYQVGSKPNQQLKNAMGLAASVWRSMEIPRLTEGLRTLIGCHRSRSQRPN
jgi:hypothetical protein